jgi:hypothetical protein
MNKQGDFAFAKCLDEDRILFMSDRPFTQHNNRNFFPATLKSITNDKTATKI